MLYRALALTPALAMAGCFMQIHHDGGFTEIDESIHTVVIEVETGEVELVAAELDGAEVEWESHWNRRCPDIDVYESNGILTVRGRCPVGAFSCSTDFRIVVPPGVEVDATVTTGSLELADVGPVLATLTTGELDIRGATGELDLELTTGGIHAYDLVTDELRASVVTGSIELELEEDFELLDAELVTGDMTIIVPEGCYDMDLDVVTGAVHTDGVSCDCDADSHVRASVITGTIDVYGE